MAGKNPAELKKEGEELKAVFAKVKKKQHNCAILTSKDGIVVETHLKKAPEILFKAAKKKGGTAKGAWGTLTMEGQVLILDPVNDKVPGSLPKIAKKFFAERGLKFRLEIKEPEEEESGASEAEAMEEEAKEEASADERADEEETLAQQEEEENEEEKSEDSPPEASAPASDDEQKAELEERMDGVQSDIDALLAGERNIMATAIEDELKKFERGMDEPDYDYAKRSMDLIDEILEDYAALKKKQQPLLDRVARMDRSIQAVLRGEDDDAAEELQTTLDEFNYNLAKSELVSAGQKLDLIEEAVGSAAEKQDSAETSSQTEEKQAAEQTPQASEPEGNSPSDTKEIRARFDSLMPTIRQAASSEDAPLKKKIALLIKGFNSELKNGDSPKSLKILDAMDSLLKNFESSATSAAPDDGVDAEEVVKVKAERKTKFMSALQDMKSELSEMMAELE